MRHRRDRPRLPPLCGRSGPVNDGTMLTNILPPTHLIIVLVVALLILGPKRLPEAGRALGQGLNEFKNSIRGSGDDDA